MKPATAIAIFWRRMARSAPIRPHPSATTRVNHCGGSFMKEAAISRPTANPSAATKSQKSFLPKKRIATPTMTLMIGTERFILCAVAVIPSRADDEGPRSCNLDDQAKIGGRSDVGAVYGAKAIQRLRGPSARYASL